jgi:hypothetical protein
MSRFNLLAGKGRQGDNCRGDAGANCLSRITNVVAALRASKSICQEMILEGLKAKRLASAPLMLCAKKGPENTTNNNKTHKNTKLKQAEAELEAVKKQGTVPGEGHVTLFYYQPAASQASFAPNVQDQTTQKATTQNHPDRMPQAGYMPQNPFNPDHAPPPYSSQQQRSSATNGDPSINITTGNTQGTDNNCVHNEVHNSLQNGVVSPNQFPPAPNNACSQPNNPSDFQNIYHHYNNQQYHNYCPPGEFSLASFFSPFAGTKGAVSTMSSAKPRYEVTFQDGSARSFAPGDDVGAGRYLGEGGAGMKHRRSASVEWLEQECVNRNKGSARDDDCGEKSGGGRPSAE